MNGRALNEKAIEVSPSSSRVLDRAAEILTPFPPSKNRPRPGDWTCPSCGFSNFQRRTACFRCSFPPVGGGPSGGDPMGGYGGYGYGGPPHMMAHPQHHMGHHGGGHGMGGHGHGHGHGGGGRGMGGGGGVVPFRAGDWKCGSDGCGYHNFAKNVSCLRCGASRAGAAVVADSSSFAGPPPMDAGPPPPSGYGMAPPPSMGGAPPPGPPPGAPFGPAAAAYGSGAFGQSPFGAPASTYALPAGIGGPAGPWQPIGTPAFSQASAGHSAGPFDSRAAEAAFANAGTGGSVAPYANAGYGGAVDGADPFPFLASGLGSLSMNDDGGPRRNGAPSNKSPA